MRAIIHGSGNSADLDVITATPSDVLSPKVIVDRDGEPVTGTLALSGNAQAGHVLAGEGFYTTDPKLKQIGNMTVNSLLSFSAQAYSGRQVLLKWQNPYAANGKPFSGVIVKYTTGTYPPWNGGTTIYAGIGDNAAPGGWSQIIVTMPSTNTAYYFTALTYVTTSLGDLYGPNYDPAAVWQASAVTQADLWLTFTASQTYTIPNGYFKMDVFAVGGGGGGAIGGYESNSRGGGGGGGGYTTTGLDLNVSPGQIIAITIGTGGYWSSYSIHNVDGGDTMVTVNPSYTLTAVGGKTPIYSYGDDGGSGGGTAWIGRGGDGASDGGSSGGKGQGRTTRAWGNGAGTLYSGGGGGGASRNINSGASGTGGAGGLGGGGAGGGQNPAFGGYDAAGGAPNTGGAGGGGGGGLNPGSSYGGTGGTGIVLLKIY